MEVYGIAKENLDVDDVLTLIDLFAIPYKAMVIRLMECRIISKQKARNLISVDSESILKRMTMIGKDCQWQNSNGLIHLGTLSDNLDFNICEGYLTEEREKSDRKLINDLYKRFLRES